MQKILTVDYASEKSNELHKQGKTIVLAGGCFDILHIGHVEFLERAKKLGDVLFVALESDETIRKGKGDNRPINTQTDRATVLAALSSVDYVILLPPMERNQDYDIFTLALKPAIIATTKGDEARHHKERQARLLGGKVIDVMQRLHTISTSRLATLLALD